MSETRITPVGIGSAVIVGGAAGVLVKQGIDKMIKVAREAKPDTFMGKTAKQASRVKGFFARHFAKDALKRYGGYIAEKTLAIYHSNPAKKTGAFLKHPATIGAALGLVVYVAAKKVIGNKFDYID